MESYNKFMGWKIQCYKGIISIKIDLLIKCKLNKKSQQVFFVELKLILNLYGHAKGQKVPRNS